jgi:hypothetical protein
MNRTSDPPQFALRRDGSGVVVAIGNNAGLPEIEILDGLTGQVVGQPSVGQSTFKQVDNTIVPGYSRIGPPMVGPDGTTFVLYERRDVDYPPIVTFSELRLVKITADNTVSYNVLTSTTTNTNLFPGRIIPAGATAQDGVIATWTVGSANSSGPTEPIPFRAALVSASGGLTPYNLPIQPTTVLQEPSGLPVNPQLALGATATAFMTYAGQVASFRTSSGVANWLYSSPTSTVSILAADSTNGVLSRRPQRRVELWIRVRAIRGSS